MAKNKRLSLLSLISIGIIFLFISLNKNTTISAPEKIIILHTNDVHCQIDQKKNKDGIVTNIGYAGVLAYKKEMENLHGINNVTLVDAGDAIQGGPIGTLSKGEYIVDIMNYVGYDIACPGNHEFDYGMENFLKLSTETSKANYICCNFRDLEGNPILSPYTLIKYGDLIIAYLGINTPESFTKSSPIYFQDENGNYIYDFAQGEKGQTLYKTVQKYVDEAIKEGANYVVAIGHLGDEGASEYWSSKSLIKNTYGIDIFIDGHSHEVYSEILKNKKGKNVLLAQTGTKLQNLGKITINTKNKKITSEFISNYKAQDEDAVNYIEGIKNKFSDVLQEVIAKSSVTLTTLDPTTHKRAIRNSETNLGDFCADAYRTMVGANIAFINGGGIRADIEEGDITYEEIINVHPFGNEICMIETTGQDILDALEVGACEYPIENGGFLQVSGLSYTIDPSIPSSVVFNERGQFVKVDGKYRVTEVIVGNEPLVLNKTYTLASHNYMIKNGGDGYTMFMDDKMIKDSVVIDNGALINYITENLNGVIGDEYKNPKGSGRIIIKENISSNSQEEIKNVA
ncbi:bifunctional metallophosphatase/5'-nucleotidase [Fusobacterium perfoetens]|uniref:bifunctional metallophosphatase/5'-nucleotidase n=1 Tax=Fusobacterium perfoetens TaxID=852 RepID=UPI001F1C85C4|nr:bifunctional UDP-sugar hydrolase/5'-nucleotidase [Fusobacterium perfoetens]MCF2612287.1 bifunctional metallophosphatase/5'-nucleotidase [Fusobacterium perfoetens]